MGTGFDPQRVDRSWGVRFRSLTASTSGTTITWTMTSTMRAIPDTSPRAKLAIAKRSCHGVARDESRMIDDEGGPTGHMGMATQVWALACAAASRIYAIARCRWSVLIRRMIACSLAVTRADAAADLSPADRRMPIQTEAQTQCFATSVAFSRDGLLVAATFGFCGVRIWDYPSGKQLASIIDSTGFAKSAAFNDRSDRIAYVGTALAVTSIELNDDGAWKSRQLSDPLYACAVAFHESTENWIVGGFGRKN